MSTLPGLRGASERAVWWSVLVASAVAGLVWAFAPPLFTGPDEVSQARRAAAVVRGELTGRQDRPGPPLLLTVDVPPLYADPAEQQWLCHLGPLVPAAPQEPMALPTPPCPDLRAPLAEPIQGAGLVEADTVQYRGQPFFYAAVGLPTLVSDGVPGAYGMRVVGVLLVAALVASAAVTLAGSRRPGPAGLGLLVCLTPGVLHLSGATNPSAVEVAAALSAWAAVGVLATAPGPGRDPATARLVRRLGVALVVLTTCRGLGPAFAGAVVVGGAVVAGRVRSLDLVRRTDVRRWAAAVLGATALSVAWLAHISSAYPLPERAGSGASDALGMLPWYLHQMVGVFGTNDSAVSPAAAGAWCLAALAVFGLGLAGLLRDGTRPARRQALVATGALVGGLALNVTAEGLSLPPIGFFWQGRYALPLLVGGILLATTTGGRRPVGPGPETAAAPPTTRASARALASVGVVATLVGIHGHAFWVVADHHGSPAGLSRAVALSVLVLALGAAAVAATVSARPGS